MLRPAGKIPIAKPSQQTLYLSYRIADAELVCDDTPDVGGMKHTDTIISGWSLVDTLPEPLKLVGIETCFAAAACLILQAVKTVSVV